LPRWGPVGSTRLAKEQRASHLNRLAQAPRGAPITTRFAAITTMYAREEPTKGPPPKGRRPCETGTARF